MDRLGVLKAVDAAGAQPLHGMRIVAPDGTVLDGAYPTSGPWRGYRDHALAIRREVFDRILLERARALPVEVRERHRVTGLIVEGGLVRGVKAEDARGRAGGDAEPPGGGRRRARIGRGARARARAAAPAAAAGAHPARERHRGAGRSRRDLRGSARLLHPESGGAGHRQRGPGGAAGPRQAVQRAARDLHGGAAAAASPRAGAPGRREGRGAGDGDGAAGLSRWGSRAWAACCSRATRPASTIRSPARASTPRSAPRSCWRRWRTRR